MFDLITDEKLLEWKDCLDRLRHIDISDAESRTDYANRLKICVGRLARELSNESFEKFEVELHQRVFDLLAQPVRQGPTEPWP